MKHIVRAGFITLAALTPAMAFAASDVQQSVLNKIGSLIQAATPIVVAFALLGFFWGLAIYIFNAGDEKKKSQGRNIMIWGILALFIMLSVFGIIRALQDTFDLQNSNTAPPIPTFDQGNTTGSSPTY